MFSGKSYVLLSNFVAFLPHAKCPFVFILRRDLPVKKNGVSQSRAAIAATSGFLSAVIGWLFLDRDILCRRRLKCLQDFFKLFCRRAFLTFLKNNYTYA